MKPIDYAIIGGSGVYESGIPSEKVFVKTEFGEVEINIAKFKDNSIGFLARHGNNHSIPPHLINYRANIKALQKLGVKHIFSTLAVGSLKKRLPVGSLVVINDFLDMTNQRKQTFFDRNSKKVTHVKMDDPYCENLREKLIKHSSRFNINLINEAIYICTEGPRFETKAEIKMMDFLGADVVGMTSVPEVVLAKELGLCYASVGFVVNMATGLESSSLKINEINEIINKHKKKINKLFMEIFVRSLDQQNCNCTTSNISL